MILFVSNKSKFGNLYTDLEKNQKGDYCFELHLSVPLSPTDCQMLFADVNVMMSNIYLGWDIEQGMLWSYGGAVQTYTHPPPSHIRGGNNFDF